MMTTQALRFIGTAMLLIGSLKAWAHSQSASVLRLPSCLGEDVLVRLDAPLWHQVHCWGCYVAIAGLLLIAAPMVQHRRQQIAKTVAR